MKWIYEIPIPDRRFRGSRAAMWSIEVPPTVTARSLAACSTPRLSRSMRQPEEAWWTTVGDMNRGETFTLRLIVKDHVLSQPARTHTDTSGSV